MKKQNLFAIVSRMIGEKDRQITTATMGRVIRNRSTMRIKDPLAGIRSLTQKAITKIYHRITFNSRNKKREL